MPGDPRKRPSHRQEFKIAIICALPLEADMVEMILDKDWADEGVKYGKAPGDLNTYTTGVIADQNVVLAYCSTIGSNNAGQVATGLRSSFTGIRLAFVVGVCGAFPYTDGEEVLLGDCMISTAVIQFDLGRFGPKGFATKDGLQGLGRAGVEIGTLLTKLKGRRSRLRLKKNLASHLHALQNEDPEWAQYPGRSEDQLFTSSYGHDHGQDVEFCGECDAVTGICGRTCTELRCGDQNLVLRKRLESDVAPHIHFGYFGSSNSVMKDANKRDAVAKANKVIAFEMEGSGVWDIYPTVVIKAACDYADSHKNKEWQPYAAAVAASGLKAFLQELDFPDEESSIQDNVAKSPDTRPAQNANDFNSSTIHGTVANNVFGGIHYHQDQPLPSTEILQQSEADIIARADAAICSYYTSGDRLEIVRLSGELLSLDKCYINLALTNRADEKNKKTENQSFSLSARLRLEASDVEKQIALEELFTPGKLPSNTSGKLRRIFIQGRAGIGKTTLCKKIVHEFLHHRLGDKLFDRLLWVPLRKLKGKSEGYGWQDLLRDVFSPRVDGWDETVVAMSKKLLDEDYLSKTLFLFDGLDEISYGWKRGDSMYEFVADMICDTPNVILTSRPQANSFSIGSFDLELETIGFDADQIHTYIETCVQSKELIPRMKEVIAQKPLLQGLLRIPIQLDAFCYTWPRRVFSKENHENAREHRQSNISGQDDLSTMTTLYQAITAELCIKDTDRLEKATQPRRLHNTKIRALLQEELDFLGELAFQGLINGIATFTPDQQDMIEAHLAQNNKATVQDTFVLERLSFLRTSDIDQDPSKRNYHFLHLTFQEFFAAKHFVRYWRANTDLMRLDLGSGSDTVEGRISPVEFLKTEKYNSQLIIFWRFVAGLTQARSYELTGVTELRNASQNFESKDVVDFFAELHNEPLDLFGYVHNRLLMYCLSEVVIGQRQEIQALYKRQQDLLRDGLAAEFKMTGEVNMFAESEFPENIICEYLQNQGDIPHKIILSKLRGRQFIATKILDIASNMLDSGSPSETRLEAIALICEKSAMASQRTLEHATQAVQVILEDKNLDISYSLLKNLEHRSDLPKQIIDLVINMVKQEHKKIWEHEKIWKREEIWEHEKIEKIWEQEKIEEHEKMWEPAISLLTSQRPMSKEIVDMFVTILRNKVSNMLSVVAEMLRQETHLPKAIILCLILLFKQRNWDVRWYAATAVGNQKSLPSEYIALLIAMLNDEDDNTRTSAGEALADQSYLPGEAITALMALIKDSESKLGAREHAAKALGKQSSLAMEDMTALITMLNDDDMQIYAVQALQGQSALPKEVIAILLVALKSENEDLRAAVVRTLLAQSSLSEEVTISLIPCLEDRNAIVRWSVLRIFRRGSSLPEQVIAALDRVLKEGDGTDKEYAAAALGTQSSLPSDVIDTLLTVIKARQARARSDAAEALGRQSILSSEALTVLITYLNKPERYYRYYAEVYRHIFANINDLDDQSLRYVWSGWLTLESWRHSISCYEYKGCLYTWSEGKRYKITNGSTQTQRLLQVLLSVKREQSSAEILQEPNEKVENAIVS